MEGPVPTAIGRYTVERLLGAGAMGNVYLARDPDLDRQVAVKVIKRLDLDPERLATFLTRFRNEARAAARLHHPNIVQVYDVGEDPNGGPFLVMEYVSGSSLKQILRRQGPFTPATLVQLADEIGEALTAAHRQGIIHRDIKPDNLLITPDGHAKLADFGVAHIPDAGLTREGQFLGTPCYAAPETLASGSYGPLTDLFSMAAVLYEVASGSRAFPGSEAVAVAHKVLHDAPEPPSRTPQGGEVPLEVDEVILQGLEKDPKRRFESPRALAHALRTAYERAGHDSLAPPPSPRGNEPTGRFPPERRDREASPFAFFAVVVGALTVGLALVLAFRSDPPTTAPLLPPDSDELTLEIATDSLGLEGDEAPLDAQADLDNLDGENLALAGGEPLDEDEGGAEVAAPAGVEDGPEPAALTAHEREELAKEALGRARWALRQGDAEAARVALLEARRYDPGNPDIEALLSQARP